MSRKSLPGIRRAPDCSVLYVSGAGARAFPAGKRHDVELRLIDAGASDATEAVRRHTRLALVWVDESAGFDGAPLVAAIKTFEPELPIVWSGRDPVAPHFPRPGPDKLVLGPPALQAGLETVAGLVRAETYHAGIIEDLCAASVEAMNDGFRVPVVIPETFFKATRAPLASVSAAVEFGGSDVEASVIVSAEAKPLRDMLKLSVPAAVASLAALHDLAGEIANHIVGRLKVTLDPGGTLFQHQSPLVLRGHEANIRAIRGRPSVVARLVAPELELFVQLHLKSPVPLRRSTGDAIGSGPGELKFLD
jgi:CheY-specific phosphatase CheX